MMRRIWRLPEAVRDGYDLDSLRIVWHLAEPCPPWLKEAWIDWLGAERIFELYGGTEAQAATIITGPQWLEHRGSVGRPTPGTVAVCDPDGVEVPPDVEGEIWMRSASSIPHLSLRRSRGPHPRRADGSRSATWAGSTRDGYLYLGDRMTDMILTGGANVYPAEVEAAIAGASPGSLVRGDRAGRRRSGSTGPRHRGGRRRALDPAELLAFLGQRLVRYKVPRTVELVADPLRDDAGKVRRSALRAERLDPPHPDGGEPTSGELGARRNRPSGWRLVIDDIAARSSPWNRT